MFELGKKDGAEKNSSHSNRTERQERSPARAEAAPVVNTTARGEVAVIGRSIRINGDLQGEEDLRIEGEVTGTVRLQNNTLTIGNEGKVRADVFAKSVVVDGVMEGDLYSSERVEIRKNATLRGNITSPRVSLEDGARFKGSMEMDPDAVNAALGTAANVAATGATSSNSAAKSSAKPSASASAKAKMNGDSPVAKPQVATHDDTGARKSAG